MEPMTNVALRAARRAGRIILRSMDRIGDLTIEEKGKNDLVSEVDRQAEDEIIDTIRKYYPSHAILGEERGELSGAEQNQDEDEQTKGGPGGGGKSGGGKSRGGLGERGLGGSGKSGGGLGGSGRKEHDAEYTWVVDPLDGTVNYLHGIPHFCTSIGIRRGSALLHGVVVDHVRNEEFTASQGDGARLNGRRLRVSERITIDESIIAASIVYGKVREHRQAYLDILAHLNDDCRTVRRQGSAALDLAYVAAGRIDGFFEIGLKPWDMVAGAVLVREAGGFVGDVAGGDRFLDTGNVLASNPRLFRELSRLIRDCAERSGDSLLRQG